MKKLSTRLFFIMVKVIAVFLMVALSLGLAAPHINPYDFWPAAFFGLAYPAIWLFSLLSACLLVKRRTWFLVIAVFVVIGLPMMLRHFSLPLVTNNGNPGKYRILTYNVHGFAGSRDGRSTYERQKMIHDFTNDRKPEIICMQEYSMKSRKHAKYIDHLNTDLKLPYKFLSEFDPEFKGTTYTFVIGSAFPIHRKGEVFTMEEESSGIFCDVEFPEGIVRVYNVHLQSVKLLGEKKLLRPHRNSRHIKYLLTYIKGTIEKLRIAFPTRAYQAWMIAESIRTSPYPVIVAGDLNDTPASYSYRLISKSLNDASLNKGTGFMKTYAESLYPLRIDHIFLDKRLILGNYSREKIYLSDHFPVTAGFSFNKDQ